MICIDEKWHCNYGQQGPGEEWTTWETYELVGRRKIGAFSFDNLESAIQNAFGYALALGVKKVQMRKEGKKLRDIKVTDTRVKEPC